MYLPECCHQGIFWFHRTWSKRRPQKYATGTFQSSFIECPFVPHLRRSIDRVVYNQFLPNQLPLFYSSISWVISNFSVSNKIVHLSAYFVHCTEVSSCRSDGFAKIFFVRDFVIYFTCLLLVASLGYLIWHAGSLIANVSYVKYVVWLPSFFPF